MLVEGYSWGAVVVFHVFAVNVFIGTVVCADPPPAPSNPWPPDTAIEISAATPLSWCNGREMIVNGGFESGDSSGWNVSDETVFVINDGAFDPPGVDGPLSVNTGDFCGLILLTNAGIQTLSQDIAVPHGAQATLTWAHRIRNFHSVFEPGQRFSVEVCDTNDALLATVFSTAPGNPLFGAWTNRKCDLSAFGGRTIRIAFRVASVGYPIHVFLDEIGLSIRQRDDAVQNEVYFGTNPQPGAAEFIGCTSASSCSVPLLSPATTYYWRVIARGAEDIAGPVWSFTTRGVDHFEWTPVPPGQLVHEVLQSGIIARDEFGRVANNFNGTVRLRLLDGRSGVLETFDSEIWPAEPWVLLGFGGIRSANDAHDGAFGLKEPEWMYRTDVQAGRAGDRLSCWLKAGRGRAYFGFGASSNGCWSAVAAANSSEFKIQQNVGFDFLDVAAVAQVWEEGRWYRIEVEFESGSIVKCRLIDPESGLLQTLTATNANGFGGGIAIRSFIGFAWDTLSCTLESGVEVSPVESGVFTNGTWAGPISFSQPASNVKLSAEDSTGRSGTSETFSISRLAACAIEARPDRRLQLRFDVPPGTECRIQYTDTLFPPVWRDLGPRTADINGICEVIEPIPTAPARFYRAVVP